MSRAELRRKVKNRGFTKKGMTRVIKIDRDGKPLILLTPVNSKIHKEAKKNAANFRKQRTIERRSKGNI
jgi:hypothetical protein